MSNPFDQADAAFLVLCNQEGQHSIWPAFLPAPAGWSCVFGPAERQACLDYVDTHWTDMRPASLRAAQR